MDRARPRRRLESEQAPTSPIALGDLPESTTAATGQYLDVAAGAAVWLPAIPTYVQPLQAVSVASPDVVSVATHASGLVVTGHQPGETQVLLQGGGFASFLQVRVYPASP